MSKVKQFLDANVWDGEDRSGCKDDFATFNPDELQELVEEALEHSLSPILESICQDIDKFTELLEDNKEAMHEFEGTENERQRMAITTKRSNARNNARVWELKKIQEKLKELLPKPKD